MLFAFSAESCVALVTHGVTNLNLKQNKQSVFFNTTLYHKRILLRYYYIVPGGHEKINLLGVVVHVMYDVLYVVYVLSFSHVGVNRATV